MIIKKLNNSYTLKIIDVRNSEDKDYVYSIIDTIYNILKNAYNNVDGCNVYTNAKHMYRTVKSYKIVEYNNIIVSCATYRIINNSYKCILIGGDINPLYKNQSKIGVQWIIKSDIANYNKFYWIEASGAIKHYCDKIGGFKIPKEYVPAILKGLRINRDIDTDDTYEYNRIIKGLDYPITKVMYGFSNKELLTNIIKESESEFNIWFNKLLSDNDFSMLIESAIDNKNNEIKHLINNTYNALNYINDMYYEDGYFITQSMLKTIKYVLKISLSIIKNNEVFEDYLLLFDEVNNS